MLGPRRLTLGCAAFALAIAVPASAQTDLADLHEDVRGLTQRVNDLSLRIEQLEHENAELRDKVGGAAARDLVSTAQLNGAVAELNASIKSAVASSRTEILNQVGTQMEILAKQTNAALDSLAKPGAPVHSAAAGPPATPAPAAKTTFADTYPKEGISYTVQKGDSLGGIAHKTGGKAQDIVDANRLADPSRIQVGQVLFIPAGKAPVAPKTL